MRFMKKYNDLFQIYILNDIIINNIYQYPELKVIYMNLCHLKLTYNITYKENINE